jgi:ZIP family zinc transporter
MEAFYGILIPFLGTSLGAACVFFMRKTLSERVQRALTGFAAGVMVAASVWSLLIPAIEESSTMGKWSFVPAAAGFWIGILFLLALDHIIPHLHAKSGQTEGPRSRLQRTTMMVLAVTLHNIPEGMAVGVVYAGYLSGSAQITAAGALALSLGIAIQNFPEGAIISMPLRAEGMKKGSAFAGGVLSGIVEPIGAVLTIMAARLIVPALPYLLSFAAGAMLYVVVEELIPEMSQGEHSNLGTVFFAVGFSVMMVLDVALG